MNRDQRVEKTEWIGLSLSVVSNAMVTTMEDMGNETTILTIVGRLNQSSIKVFDMNDGKFHKYLV